MLSLMPALGGLLTLPVLEERGFLDLRLVLLSLAGTRKSRGQISPSV
ncbi:hypothetical protein [Moorena sp. SIO3A5]|nr:hypothetical protein [Moorena sp. SIO3A5]NER88517.1 hypothetical protein [Moorena sp. SIO3A2]